MSSVLRNIVESRQAEAGRASGRRATAAFKDFLRLVSLAVMAIAVYVYHSELFDAAQPFITRFYEMTGR